MSFVFYLLNFVILFLFFFWLWRREHEGLRPFFFPAVFLKLAAGIGLGILYSFYYTGDTFLFFEEGKQLSKFARSYPGEFLYFLWSDEIDPVHVPDVTFSQPRTLFFVKFVTVINLITGDNYWLSSLYCSSVSFIGAWSVVRRVHIHLPQITLPAVVAFHFFPSVVFWTSGIIKESLACAALFYLASVFLQAWFRQTIPPWKSLLGVFALWLLWGLKYYYAAIFIPVVFTSLMHKNVFSYIFKPKTLSAKLLLWLAIFLPPLVIVSFLHPAFYFENFLQVIVENNQVYSQFSENVDIIHYFSLKPTVISVLINSPWALFSGLFRPLLFEAGNLMQVVAGLENTLVLIVFLVVIVRLRHVETNGQQTLIFTTIVYVCCLCIFLSLSTPNFGTLSRYKVSYLPFFLLLLLSTDTFNAALQRIRWVLFKR